jgi:hypothetical protein
VFRADGDPLFTATLAFDEMVTDWVQSRENTRLAARTEPVADYIVRGLRGGA